MCRCIIACRTLEKELLAAMANTGCTCPVHWLEAGGHNIPDKRRSEIQAALDACGEFDTVLLAMSLCGNLVAGLQTRDFQVVIPRCDDCITLLLGSRQHRLEYPATYFLTAGWLSGKDNLWIEYQRTLAKYGLDRTRRIFSAMLGHYSRLAFVDTGSDDVWAQVQEIAAGLGLAGLRIAGDSSWLEELLQPRWDPARFLILPPRSTLTPEECFRTF